MNNTHNILIRDPYLNSTTKTDNQPLNTSHNPNQNKPSVDIWKYSYEDSKSNKDIYRQLEQTKNQFHRMSRAYTDQNRLNKKILNYQAMNSQYHQALKLRNLDLNNKLVGLATDNKILNQQLESDYMKNYHDKETIIKKYQQQCDEILNLKRSINQLLQIKTKMQQQIQHLHFVIQTQSDRFALEVRQQVIRIQGMQRTIKNITETKDQQIFQLRNRIRIYQDQNKRLVDENRTLNLTNKDYQNKKTLQNISHIQHLDSQMKASDHKQNYPYNHHNNHHIPQTLQKQLNQQKIVNDKLQKQINDLKKRLFHDGNQDNDIDDSAGNNKNKNRYGSDGQVQNIKGFDFDKSNGYITSIITLRNGIDKEVFDVFFKSVRDGEKHRSNSLVIFIENWTHLDIERLQPYIDSYFQARNCLKDMYKSHKSKGQIQASSPTASKIEECIPLHIGSRKGRSQINQWILSTIQFTKNQRQSSKKSMNNLLLFLFRLLTIQYRITYPMQGKSYTIDNDVKYQLHHEIVKAIDYIRKFK